MPTNVIKIKDIITIIGDNTNLIYVQFYNSQNQGSTLVVLLIS